MDASAWLAAASLAFALLSGGAAAWAWWQANRSRAARTEAEAAVSRAERAVSATESMAASFAGLVNQVTPEPLVVDWQSHDAFEVRNTTGDPIEILGYVNRDETSQMPFVVPVTIPPGQVVRGRTSAKYSSWPFPTLVVLNLRDRPQPIVLRFANRPPRP